MLTKNQKLIDKIKKLLQVNEIYFFQNPLLIKITALTDNIGNFIFKKNKEANFDKILISNIGHLGDLLLSLKFIEIMKEKFPNSKIYFLCNIQAKSLLINNPNINKIITYNPFFVNENENFFKKLVSLIKTIFKIKKTKADIAFDLRSSFPNTIPLLKLGGIKYIVGFPTVGFGFLLDKKIAWDTEKHEIENIFNLIRWKFDICEFSKDNNLNISYFGKESSDIKKLIEKIKNNYILCNIFSRNTKKMINLDSWEKVIKYYNRKYYIIITGSKDDNLKLVEKFIRLDKVINLTGRTTISDLIYILKNAKFTITIDSFIGQLCSILDIPSAIIFKGFVNIKRFGPLGKNCHIILSNVECLPCYNTTLYKSCNAQKCGDLELLSEIIKINPLI
ncbi:MAG: glycosyltransferase family 9 protein [Candidatus Goldbacteria bacterium]|nr:glycosyltransferase family 9 protein [Candidatus Goldiibacteriota bacterium]